MREVKKIKISKTREKCSQNTTKIFLDLKNSCNFFIAKNLIFLDFLDDDPYHVFGRFDEDDAVDRFHFLSLSPLACLKYVRLLRQQSQQQHYARQI